METAFETATTPLDEEPQAAADRDRQHLEIWRRSGMVELRGEVVVEDGALVEAAISTAIEHLNEAACRNVVSAETARKPKGASSELAPRPTRLMGWSRSPGPTCPTTPPRLGSHADIWSCSSPSVSPDRGVCRYPGCTSRHVDAHHLTPWERTPLVLKLYAFSHDRICVGPRPVPALRR